ncbi:ABC transporter permease [Lederbergia lenta]|uniref:Putative ABC transporter, permease protein n=1 Tax=Lederbergia lenta TaxID=1467 RepID=A0A2X4YSX7_LEDLE|nr:ABC transporter permease [Lederbergia lenta]MEC2323768.1 ABC transporter permease [Lederbergia lenta]SQI51474.1 putative ABC transporter, permease protein [Lederbergia lenta]
MRVIALVIRILRQIVRDKRTMGLLIFAPILVLTMMHLVFNGDDYVPKIGLVNISEVITDQISFENAIISEYSNVNEAKKDLANQDLDGYLMFEKQTPAIFLEGSDPAVNGSVLQWLQTSLPAGQINDSNANLKIDYLHGSSKLGQFDYFGPVLLGFFVFFFVFLIAGVSFLRERTTGTLERLLSSPLRRWEIVIGYVLGFGIFATIQSTIIAAYAIYVLGMAMEGAFAYVLLITLLLSLTALTLGILLSAFANNELQMMQFIPVIVIPQIFFSGLFNLETISKWLSWIGPFTPLFYAADALRNVMVRGYGWGDIYIDILALIGFSILFMTLNILALRKYRKI